MNVRTVFLLAGFAGLTSAFGPGQGGAGGQGQGGQGGGQGQGGQGQGGQGQGGQGGQSGYYYSKNDDYGNYGYYGAWGQQYYYYYYTDTDYEGTCSGSCGQQSTDCYCDDYCLTYNDCCDDYLQLCAGTVSQETCAGMCGDESGMQGCYCDNLCDDYGDCCDDYDTLCHTENGCNIINNSGWFLDGETWESFWYGAGWMGWDTWNGNWVLDMGVWNYGQYDEVDCTFVEEFTFVGLGYCRGDDMNDYGDYDTIYVDALEICGAECLKDDDCTGIEWQEEGACELHYGWVPSQVKVTNNAVECWAKSEYSEIEMCNYFSYGWFYTGQYWEQFAGGSGWQGMDTWNGNPVFDWGSWNLGWHSVSTMCDGGSGGSGGSGGKTDVTLVATETSNGVYQVTYVTNIGIEGFEIDECDITAAYGGDAEDTGFYLTVGQSSGIVIAVSFAGTTIDAGSGTLVILEGNVDANCEFIVSDDKGTALSYTLEVEPCKGNKC